MINVILLHTFMIIIIIMILHTNFIIHFRHFRGISYMLRHQIVMAEVHVLRSDPFVSPTTPATCLYPNGTFFWQQNTIYKYRVYTVRFSKSALDFLPNDWSLDTDNSSYFCISFLLFALLMIAIPLTLDCLDCNSICLLEELTTFCLN